MKNERYKGVRVHTRVMKSGEVRVAFGLASGPSGMKLRPLSRSLQVRVAFQARIKPPGGALLSLGTFTAKEYGSHAAAERAAARAHDAKVRVPRSRGARSLLPVALTVFPSRARAHARSRALLRAETRRASCTRTASRAK